MAELNLSGNQLTGPIPPELGNLSNLEWLYLAADGLSGPIPPELGNLVSLRWLDLWGNQLTGPIPPELGNLSNLTRLRLYRNSSLSGPLPGSFTGLTSLQLLWLQGTQLCAPTDAAFQAWLQGIDDKNGVVNCGVIPPTVSLSASPASIERGRSATLTWSSIRAVSATIDQGIGAVPTSGSRRVSPTRTTTYRITVRGTDGQTASDSTTVTVTEPPASLAPADQDAFNDVFVGKRALTDDPNDYIDFISPGRFTEGSDEYPGSYTYGNTGSNTGTLTLNYDDGERCTSQLTFTSATSGRATFSCNDGTSGSSSWRLVEIPSDDGEKRYEVDDVITTVPDPLPKTFPGGQLLPPVGGLGAQFGRQGTNWRFTSGRGGYFEIGDYRYTCDYFLCGVENRVVTFGTIVETSTENNE